MKKKRKKCEETVLGLDSGNNPVGVGTTVVLATTCHRRCTPQRMSLTGVVARAFIIHDIRNGVEPYLITSAPVSAAIFRPFLRANALRFRSLVLEVGMDLSVTVTNVWNKPARFTSSVVAVLTPYVAPPKARGARRQARLVEHGEGFA